MRNTRIQKSPLVYEGSSIVHRRSMTGIKAVCEQGNFTRRAEFSANLVRPEV